MTSNIRIAWRAGLAGLMGLSITTSARADVMYSVRDVGTTSQSQIGLNNLTGRRFLEIDGAGKVSLPNNDVDPTTYTGPIPTGMRPLNDYYPKSSPDGQYQVGTAFANQAPSAYWSGFVVHDGVASGIGTLSGSTNTSFSEALGVNNSGTIVGGSSLDSGFSHAIVVDASGKMTDLGTIGNWYNAALAINNAGTIVGEGGDVSNYGFRAFISDGHSLTDLNTLIDAIPGFTLVSATAINDAGQIAAYGHFATDPESLLHEVLLSPNSLGLPDILPVAEGGAVANPPPAGPQPAPIPEPSALAAFGLVAALATARRLKSRRHL